MRSHDAAASNRLAEAQQQLAEVTARLTELLKEAKTTMSGHSSRSNEFTSNRVLQVVKAAAVRSLPKARTARAAVLVSVCGAKRKRHRGRHDVEAAAAAHIAEPETPR